MVAGEQIVTWGSLGPRPSIRTRRLDLEVLLLKPEGLEPEGFLSKSQRLDPEVPLNLGGVRPEVCLRKPRDVNRLESGNLNPEVYFDKTRMLDLLRTRRSNPEVSDFGPGGLFFEIALRCPWASYYRSRPRIRFLLLGTLRFAQYFAIVLHAPASFLALSVFDACLDTFRTRDPAHIWARVPCAGT
ncbi:hypothetical protein F2Q69_00007142 [Brassica cretica]|uniref:Uncharacterized protein n=1 Tax=Brassica cretica TaxID=69181 RepID=A0A8S9PLF1_BRACR|nr:hypothetical protein F2Q69_00007142 [Brassica cretica]